MDENLNHLLGKLKLLEEELLVEIHKKEAKFGYVVREGKVHFQAGMARKNARFVKKLGHYLRDARTSSFLTTPVILSCVLPVALLDLWASTYQWICFPAYGIPKVRRSDYVILDRKRLQYLNLIEKWNCGYCGYVNGVMAYVQEMAGRTEQHWCPIKHAIRLKTMHSRYQHFLDYGDAEQYRKRLEDVRRDFSDLKEKEPQSAETGLRAGN